MIAFHGNQRIKDEAIARMREHAERDRLVQGTYWRFYEGQHVGCAVGCMVAEVAWQDVPERDQDAHQLYEAYEPLLGVPRELARVEEAIFEDLPADEAREWPVRFLEAIPVGADLSELVGEFAYDANWTQILQQLGYSHDAEWPEYALDAADRLVARLEASPVPEPEPVAELVPA